MPPQSAQPSSSSRAPGSKSVLFCPDCGHESSVDGDWRVQETGRGAAYRCPECGATVTVRRSEGVDTHYNPIPSPRFTSRASAGGSPLSPCVDLTVAWTAWSCDSHPGRLPAIPRHQ